MPATAAFAFLMILLLTYLAGSRMNHLMSELQSGYSPALELGRDLEEDLSLIQRGFQDAVASDDPDALKEVDSIHDRFVKHLQQGDSNHTLQPQELGIIRTLFESYYQSARINSLRMIQGETGQQLASSLEAMRLQYNGLHSQLQRFTELQRTKMEQAFQITREKHRRSIIAINIITVTCLLALIFLSWYILRLLTRQLNQAVAVADGLAAGQTTGAIEITSEDEIGRLLGRMQNMVSRVQSRTEELEHEIAERKRLMSALKQSENDYRGLFENAHDAILIFEPHTVKVLEVNQTACEVYGYTREQFLGLSLAAISRDPEMARLRIKDTLESGSNLRFETVQFRKDHSEMFLEINASLVQYKGETAILSINRDITERKRVEDQLLRDAFYDDLTGLPNRALFIDRLEHAIQRTRRRNDIYFAVLFLDLDRFKLINDSLGHLAGDQLLIQLARRLEDNLWPGDTVARLGGDEFAILVEDIRDIKNANLAAEKIQNKLTLPFNLDGHEVFTTASIGIAVSATGYETPEEILRDADIAMYRAKSLGKARHELFDSTMRTRAIALMTLENDMRLAIQRNEFRVHYQPIFSLRNNELKGFEALIRWEHPVRGIIYPQEFVPLAEETGMILPIGRWILYEASRQMHRWHQDFRSSSPLSISVNLSGRQLLQPQFADSVNLVLRETGLTPSCLNLELTESMLMENSDLTSDLLSRLKALDVQLSLDDFGTGYSSLSYLHRFPIDTLKIDRSFISNMEIQLENHEIVRTIISLAKNLGMMTVAEGVETVEQLCRLKDLSCDLGQGYYFSRAMDVENATRFIASVHDAERGYQLNP